MAEEFTKDELSLPSCKYEYLDRTADIQLHSWGDSLKEAFEQCVIAMFGYMTGLPTVKIKQSSEIQVKGPCLESLMFRLVDELAFLFSSEPFFICSKVTITEFVTKEEDMSLKCKCYGEEFVIGKHTQRKKFKNIIYSAMQFVNEPEEKKFEIFVLIDI